MNEIEKAQDIILVELKKRGKFYNELWGKMFDSINTPDMMADADSEYIVNTIMRRIIGEE